MRLRALGTSPARIEYWRTAIIAGCNKARWTGVMA
jgi:hypothetical protein